MDILYSRYSRKNKKKSPVIFLFFSWISRIQNVHFRNLFYFVVVVKFCNIIINYSIWYRDLADPVPGGGGGGGQGGGTGGGKYLFRFPYLLFSLPYLFVNCLAPPAFFLLT